MLSPALIYAAVRDALIVAVLGFILYKVYSAGKNAEVAGELQRLQAQMAQQAVQLATWNRRNEDANATHDASVARINSAPVVLHDWVREPSALCAGPVLPTTPATPRGDAGTGGRDQSVTGAATSDGGVRDAAIAAWKRDWETRLADWRLEDAQWPTTH